MSDNENIWMSFLKKPTIYDKKQEIVFYKVFHILKIIEKDRVFMNEYNRMNQIQVYRAAIKIQKENVYKEQTLQNQLEEKQKQELKLRQQFEIQRNENEKQLESKIQAIYSEADRTSILQCFETFINHKIFLHKLQIHVSIIKRYATHLKMLKSYMKLTIRSKIFQNAKEVFFRYLNR
ncbi:Hypothetical_protein [Hexamita inflata]|uniref:Hypothetical_protein n=1 Tax=Hexamita inflata TaxID=28002 RepID=A0AA86QUY1_9EUKA|nr:Hypothetical protein HINF_LOCUS54141 [Hexamita inflata]